MFVPRHACTVDAFAAADALAVRPLIVGAVLTVRAEVLLDVVNDVHVASVTSQR